MFVGNQYTNDIVEGYHSVRSILLLQNFIFLYKSLRLSMRRFMKIKCLITIGYSRGHRDYKAQFTRYDLTSEAFREKDRIIFFQHQLRNA